MQNESTASDKKLPKGIYDRRNKGKPGKPVFWLSYAITEELRIKHGLKSRTVREPSGVSDIRSAKARLAARRRMVREGTWLPVKGSSPEGLTLEAYAEQWLARREAKDVRSVRNERQRLRDYVYPALGKRLLHEIRRADVKQLMDNVQSNGSKYTGKPLAPRTIHRVYEDIRSLFEDAVADEHVVASPCTLRAKRSELPAKKDADPRWRSAAIYTREELQMLAYDERIPEQRRVLYALAFLGGGMRIGEAVARKWGDLEREHQPLPKLVVATQYDDRELKTENPREVPAHPALLAILDRWATETFPKLYGHAPRPQDRIVPKRKGTGPISNKRAWHNLQKDLERLGLRERRVHDLRRSFVSLAIADGADRYLLGWITHGPPKAAAFDAYATPPWEALCKQVARLRFGPPGHV